MQRIGFCLIDGYAMMSTAAALEPLRAANLFSQKPLYDITCLSINGGAAKSSLPAAFETTSFRQAGTNFDVVFVVAGGDPFALNNPTLFRWLRELDRRGVALGGISGGAGILAAAGVLAGHRFTIHWHHLDDLRRRHPKALVERRLFVLDRNRYTCAGGTAPLDMMNALIMSQHGTSFARKISNWFIQTQVRAASTPQLAGVEDRYGKLPKPVMEAIELMESHIADPLSAEQLSSLVGLSARQLQRKFTGSLGLSPTQCYRNIRLEKARDLALHSPLPAQDVAEVTGFVAASSFSTAYSKRFGESFMQTRSFGHKQNAGVPDV